MSTISEQFQEFQTAENKAPIRDGDTCYLIDMKWFENFQKIGKNPDQFPSEILPTTIDNSEIFDPNVERNVSMSVPSSRFKAITSKGWNILMKWFKCDKVIISSFAIDLNDSLLKPVLKYIKINASYNNSNIPISINEYTDIDNLHKDLRTLFNISQHDVTELYIFKKDTNQKVEFKQNLVQYVTESDKIFLEKATNKRNFQITCFDNYIFCILVYKIQEILVSLIVFYKHSFIRNVLFNSFLIPIGKIKLIPQINLDQVETFQFYYRISFNNF